MLHTNVVGLNVVNILSGIVFNVHGAYRKHLYFEFFFFPYDTLSEEYPSCVY